MSSTARITRVVALTAAIAFPLTLGACGSSTSASPAGSTAPTSSSGEMSSSTTPSMAPTMSPSMSSSMSPSMGSMSPSMGSMSPSMGSMSPSASMSMASQPFGSGCASVPKSGKGSFDGMSKDPVATAASNNPALSTLVTAVKAAGLVDTLNNAPALTVFAPANSAFAAVDPTTMKKAQGDPKGLLTDVLTAHVVAGRLSPADLAGTHQSLNKKQKVTVTGSGTSFKVNGQATVVCGNVQTANATVYIIDHVLLPKS